MAINGRSYQFNQVVWKGCGTALPDERKRNTRTRKQHVFCLASSGIYVQNLIQFGNSSGSTVRFFGASRRLHRGRPDRQAQPAGRVIAALYGRL
jgi:hypothetical protein